ncbi:MAG: EVE domain-containing protein [Lysobacteraceae bacterium]
MSNWLMKSEPEEFSIDDLKRVRREPWTGVRNYQARNFMRDDMKVGDTVLFYHSNCADPGVVGLARVASKPYDDPTQFDPESDYYDPKSDPDAARWQMVDIAYKRRFKQTVSLQTLKANAEALGDFALTRRGNRLSVLPVSDEQLAIILELEKQAG